jgi:hypothetical protein
MKKSGLSASPFFSNPPQTLDATPSPVVEKPAKKSNKKGNSVTNEDQTSLHRDTTVSRHHDTVIPSNHDTVTPRHRDTVVPDNDDVMIEMIRKSVKELGKEAATHRFTVEEKRGVSDLIYAYKGAGIKTHENEVARIALNYILEDYKQNGKNSILDKVLKALNE